MSQARYWGSRVANSLMILWGTMSLTFLLMHLAPGDPSSIYIRPEIDPETVALIRQQMGLDLPLWQQYFVWLKEMVSGHFGFSFSHNQPVAEVLLEAIPNTLLLTVSVFVLQLIIGMTFGLYSALAGKRLFAKAIDLLLLFFYSIPGFWLALMAIFVFSGLLGWLPSSHMASFENFDNSIDILLDYAWHLVLPASVLALPFSAQTARLIESSLRTVLASDYIRTATAFGLSRRRIVLIYAMKNALLPLISLWGIYFPFLIGGSAIIEYIFSWPGMGQLLINAVFAHDTPTILGATTIGAFAVVLGNMLADILAAFIDPRIRLT